MGNTERQIILGEETPTSGIVLPASGVTYFKLKDKIYEGDDTKNCGLVGAEMDNNFFVLRGLDIKSMDLSGGTLTLTKFNGGAFSAEVENTLFEFNKEEGKLTITYPNGEETTLEGFVGETDSKYDDLVLATDGTIKGNGIPSKPLRLSELEKTGTYAPVDAVVGELPETGAYKGQRLIVQETLSNYGLLYPYEGIEMINDALEKISSEWRVPSREDWDSLLNYFECEEKKNHGGEGEWLGEKAGVALKSELLWKESSEETMGMDAAGFRALPMGYKCMGDDGTEIEGVGRKAAFWALDTDASNNSCVKIFEYDKATVGNFYLNKANKCSLRLCKDYNKDNFSETEDIFGLPYSCVLIDNKIWTSVNVYFSNAEYSGITSDEWKKLADYIEVSPQPNYSAEVPEKCDDVSMYYKKAEDGSFVKCAEGEKADGKTTYYTPYIQEQEEKYFLAEWDGNVWLKKPMNIGDSVAIESYDGETYHEWRLFGDGLKDVAVTSMDIVVKELIKEADSRIAADKELDAKIQKHSEILGSKIDKLNGDYDASGSVKNTAKSILETAITTDGFAESRASHSLARKISGTTNPSQYYISPYASDMYIKIKSTDSAGTATETDLGLQNYIESLEERIAKLETLLTSNDFISGTAKEIKVSSSIEGKWTIGFADDAVFYDNNGTI